MSSKFQEWYASEVQKQLKSVPLDKVKVDLTAAVVKTNGLGILPTQFAIYK